MCYAVGGGCWDCCQDAGLGAGRRSVAKTLAHGHVHPEHRQPHADKQVSAVLRNRTLLTIRFWHGLLTECSETEDCSNKDLFWHAKMTLFEGSGWMLARYTLQPSSSHFIFSRFGLTFAVYRSPYCHTGKAKIVGGVLKFCIICVLFFISDQFFCFFLSLAFFFPSFSCSVMCRYPQCWTLKSKNWATVFNSYCIGHSPPCY